MRRIKTLDFFDTKDKLEKDVHYKLPADRSFDSRVVLFLNNKGGCRKTTTAGSFMLYTARSGRNALGWDFDPQCNLTQGFEVPKIGDKDMERFFTIMKSESFIKEQSEIPFSLQIHGFQGIRRSGIQPGKIDLVAGSPFSELEAISMKGKLNVYRNIFKLFKDSISFHSDYYDMQVIDTAPTIEGRILNQLAINVTTDVIIPIDGLEAARGINHVLHWIDQEVTPSYGFSTERPNVFFVMTKSVNDLTTCTSEIRDEDEVKNRKVRNKVYKILKILFPDYVCETRIKEKPSLSSENVKFGGIGRNNPYENLCKELTEKILHPPTNIYNYWGESNDIAIRLDKALRAISETTIKKEIEYKQPVYLDARKEKDGLEIRSPMVYNGITS